MKLLIGERRLHVLEGLSREQWDSVVAKGCGPIGLLAPWICEMAIDRSLSLKRSQVLCKARWIVDPCMSKGLESDRMRGSKNGVLHARHIFGLLFARYRLED